MRLLKLYANKDSFNTINFNSVGVSIISAVNKTNDSRKTYNSVGKSLSIAIIHFCLGSNAIPDFETKLAGWVFKLDFAIDDTIYTATRRCSEQNKIILNRKELTIKGFRDYLSGLLFDIPENTKYLTFRSLISRFIRPYKDSYNHYDTFISDEDKNPVQKLINNSFLLGLDVSLILEKSQLKSELDDVENFKKKIEKEPIIKSFYGNESSSFINIQIVELETEVERLEKSLTDFQIAEDYYEVKKNADFIVNQLTDYRNLAAKYRYAIEDIDKSLAIKSDLKTEDVRKFFEKATIEIPELIYKKISEVEEFHSKIIQNRTIRLVQEKRNFELELKRLDQNIAQLGESLDSELAYLDNHGALEEFSQLNSHLSSIKLRLDKLIQYRLILKEYKNRAEELKQEFSKHNQRTANYLSEIDDVISENIKTFKSFVARFFRDKSSGITVINNEGINKQRFEIEARIQDDAGDAVNEVKIFCFDWTILVKKFNHHIGFIFHDSRITDGMDPRQIRTIFNIANEECKKHDLQYCISLNQDVLNRLKLLMDDDEYKNQIEDNIVLELSDESDETKLLGIQVDLKYKK